jgi:hypothetical protein
MCKRKLLLLLIFANILINFPACKKYYASDLSDKNSGNNISGSEDPDDYVWDGNRIVDIVLDGTSIIENSDSVTVTGSKVTIISSGTYNITGSLTDGQIIVNTDDEQIVRLIFNGINITCSNSAPVYIKKAAKAMIVLADNTENYVTDGASYILNSNNEPDAAIFSKSYISFFGAGKLTVDGNFKDGIAGKDGLIIKSGTININSADDGIRGKDYIIIRDGNITVKSGGDGLKSDNDEDADYGYIDIEKGTCNITASQDGINAQTRLNIDDGTFIITTGGGAGSAKSPSDKEGPPPQGGNNGGYSGTISEKALKAEMIYY